MSAPTNVLAARDINASAPTVNHSETKPTSDEDGNMNKPKTMEYHRQVLQSRIDEDKYVQPPCFTLSTEYLAMHMAFVYKDSVDEALITTCLTYHSPARSKQTYISPSDTIMSPCTAKLSAYKSKHFMK